MKKCFAQLPITNEIGHKMVRNWRAKEKPEIPPTLPEGVKKLNFSRHPGENRGPGNW
jgi:hypothetical protein